MGNPGKIVKYRFDEETINKLMSLDYNSISIEYIKENIQYFNKPLTGEILESIKVFTKEVIETIVAFSNKRGGRISGVKQVDILSWGKRPQNRNSC